MNEPGYAEQRGDHLESIDPGASPKPGPNTETKMPTILLVVLLLLVFGGLPNWGYHQYGYGPSGLGGILLLIFVVMMLTGRLRY